MSAPIRITLGVPNDSQPIPVVVIGSKQRRKVDVTAPVAAGKVPEYDGSYSVTPTEQEQTLPTNGFLMKDDVSVDAIPSGYVGSGVPRHDSSSLSASGATVSVPAGYYEESASKDIPNASWKGGSRYEPIVSVQIDENGLITGSVNTSSSVQPLSASGYAEKNHNYGITIVGSGTKQLPTKGATTYAPSTSDQTIAASTYLTGAQTIEGDANLIAENIKAGVTIFGVTGTYSGGGLHMYTSSDWDGAEISLPQGISASDFASNVKGVYLSSLSFEVEGSTEIMSYLAASYYSTERLEFCFASRDLGAFILLTLTILNGSCIPDEMIIDYSDGTSSNLDNINIDSLNIIK